MRKTGKRCTRDACLVKPLYKTVQGECFSLEALFEMLRQGGVGQGVCKGMLAQCLEKSITRLS